MCERLSVWKPRQSGADLGGRPASPPSGCGLGFFPQVVSPGSLPPLSSEGHTGHLQVGVGAASIWMLFCLTLEEGLGTDGQVPRELPAAYHDPLRL